jgi:hypothetical protein
MPHGSRLTDPSASKNRVSSNADNCTVGRAPPEYKAEDHAMECWPLGRACARAWSSKASTNEQSRGWSWWPSSVNTILYRPDTRSMWQLLRGSWNVRARAMGTRLLCCFSHLIP